MRITYLYLYNVTGVESGLEPPLSQISSMEKLIPLYVCASVVTVGIANLRLFQVGAQGYP